MTVVRRKRGEPLHVKQTLSMACHPQTIRKRDSCGIMPSVLVMQAAENRFGIDTKMDDGSPQTGKLTAHYLDHSVAWAGTGSTDITGPYTIPVAGDPTTCFDNDNVNGAKQHYSTEIKDGSNINCALSFEFQ
jgi:hypothetical protein